ncbi:flavodoxin domain-containing protein [Citreimonas salinaria]|uniref:Protoporphyrinogen IX oxidase, menaquinone-dependent (Flavodoxin domain) n=1 Tax=Citreimonas salinaria TaxID=321339 RepID=A0A1H3L074_9RHOB|nr:flavodoxin domain-containing protein [Citreimonas salinaria]SDY57801.1 Protoporphyrinogen IX oxidase, menaquinone-dependent (flavodoxin domain) [Citreimonas salinaria]
MKGDQALHFYRLRLSGRRVSGIDTPALNLICRKSRAGEISQNADKAQLQRKQATIMPEVQMAILIAFGTVEGQTGKIARFAEGKVREAGLEAVLFDTANKTAPVSFDGVDKVILAAPVHERRHPVPFEIFIAAHREALAARRTLLLSVSLSAAFPEGLAEADDYLIEMKMRTQFTPDAEALVAGAVQTRKYDYFATQVVRHVVLRDRGYDPSKGEHEFTDWDALAATLDDFLALEAPRRGKTERLAER